MRSLTNILFLVLALLIASFFLKPLGFLSDLLTFNYFKKSDAGKDSEKLDSAASKVQPNKLPEPLAHYDYLAQRILQAMRMHFADVRAIMPNPSFADYWMPYHMLTIQEAISGLNVNELRAVYAAFGSQPYGIIGFREYLTLDEYFQKELSANDYQEVYKVFKATKLW